MEHRFLWVVLAILLAAVAVFDIAKGILVLAGVWTPAVTYQGTLFASATVPMLLVAIVIGGSALLAATTVISRHAWGLFFAAAAGLIMVAWEVAEIVVVRQYSAIFVVVGLAVIALAEYLWTMERRGQRLPPMQHEVTRIALVVLEAVVGVAAIDGGLALLSGALSPFVSVAWLAGTPFGDYTIPGLALVVVVGGGALLGATTVFIHREWAVVVSVLAGLLMAGYEVVEVVSIDGKVGDALPTALGLQLLFFALGLAIVGLAWSLWTAEYPRRRFRLRHASPA